MFSYFFAEYTWNNSMNGQGNPQMNEISKTTVRISFNLFLKNVDSLNIIPDKTKLKISL